VLLAAGMMMVGLPPRCVLLAAGVMMVGYFARCKPLFPLIIVINLL
jgi:hypothetical protein